MAPWLDGLPPQALRDWAGGLGIRTFVGTSGRVFPAEMKAAPLLRGWLHRLRAAGLRLHMRHHWLGWQPGDAPTLLRFDTPAGAQQHQADAVLLALGGASWPQLGSDGAWWPQLAARGVDLAPLQPANCGFDIGWSPYFAQRFAGAPVKSERLRFDGGQGAPFDKPEVREALNMALDRAQIVQAVYFGRGVPGGPLSPALANWALPVSDFPCYKPDAEGARKKLAAAGVALPLKMTLKVIGSLPQAVDASQVIQAQLNKAGFEITLNVQEQGKFIADWRASDFDGFVSLNGGNPDPDDYFGRTFQTGGATNVFKYSNPALDTLLADGRTQSDPAKRKPIYDAAQRILACQGPVMHIAYGTLFAAARDEVQGFAPMPTRSLRTLRDAKLGK